METISQGIAKILRSVSSAVTPILSLADRANLFQKIELDVLHQTMNSLRNIFFGCIMGLSLNIPALMHFYISIKYPFRNKGTELTST